MKNKDHPLYVMQILDTNGIAGIERHVLTLAEELIAQGVTCEIVSNGCNALGRLAARTAIPLATAFNGDTLFVKCWRLFRYVRKKNPDVLHAHNGNSKMAAVLVGGFLKKPVVFTQHFLKTRSDHSLMLGKPRSYCHAIANSRVKRIIAVSNCVAEGMRKRHGCQPANMTVIPLGVKEPAQRHDSEVCESALRSQACRIAYIGRLEPERQPELLIDALGIVNEWTDAWEAFIIGEGSRLRSCRQLSDRLHLSSKITFTGWREDVTDILHATDILANPCAVESFGLSTLEAMAIGKPVVAIKANGSSELVQDGETGILTENNPLAFSCGILRLLENPEEAKKMGSGGRRRFQERYTAKKMTDSIIAMYKEVAI
jgi:glycosyltransferase involved in cell wall biosynthesis